MNRTGWNGIHNRTKRTSAEVAQKRRVVAACRRRNRPAKSAKKSMAQINRLAKVRKAKAGR